MPPQTLEEVLSGLDGKQMRAIALKFWNALGGQENGADNVQRLLAGKLRITVEGIIQILFSKHGRFIPEGIVAAVCDANRDFRLNQPAIDYGARLARAVRFFPAGSVFPTAEEFQQKTEAILARIQGDKTIANLAKGVYLPIVLPQTPVGDYGKILNEVFLAAVGASYADQFPDRTFTNHRHGELEGTVTIIAGTRHDGLVARMVQGPIVAVFFPNPLQGFSVDAQREQIATLPEYLLLGGGFDWASALVEYPDVLARDFHTPGMDFSALQWHGPQYSLSAKANGDGLCVDFQSFLGGANGDYSGALVALGE